MKKYIRKQFMVITTLSIGLTFFLLCFVCYDLFRTQVFSRFNIRITLIDDKGVVVADSMADSSIMSEHSDREEIIEAWQEGIGYAVRKSDTVERSSYYAAIKINDNLVLRVSTTNSNVIRIIFKLILSVFFIIAALWLLCMLLANILADNIIRPIKALAENTGSGDEVQTYEELEPFMNTIKKQHNDIMASAKIRQEFTANVSHELKTPLTSISGYSELIEAGMTKDEDTRRFASEIHKSANRLLFLINDILELSKLDTLEDVPMEEVDLFEIAENCVDMLKLSASKRGVTIKVHGSNAMVLGSKRMLEEVLYNLCDNAIRYNVENGRVYIHIQDAEDKVTVQIKDTGIGIPKEHQERVFERFYRVDKSRSKSTGGTGLGLAIVKHIIAIHGASIELESEEHVGTLITIAFDKFKSEV